MVQAIRLGSAMTAHPHIVTGTKPSDKRMITWCWRRYASVAQHLKFQSLLLEIVICSRQQHTCSSLHKFVKIFQCTNMHWPDRPDKVHVC